MFGFATPEQMQTAIFTSWWFAFLIGGSVVYSILAVLEERHTINLTEQKYFAIMLGVWAVILIVLLVMPYLKWITLIWLVILLAAIVVAIFWWRHFHH